MLAAVASLIFTIGLLLLGLHFLRRLNGRVTGQGRGVPLEIIRRIATGPRHGVALLRVGGRVLVVSIAEDGAKLLTELDGEERAEALSPAPARPAAAAALSARFPWLARVSLVVALVGLPLVGLPSAVHAQGAVGTPKVTAPIAPSLKAPAVQGPTAPKIELTIGQGADELKLSGAVGIVVFMGAMTLLPALFLLMTSFTRIVIVLHFLRTALGTQNTPPTQLLVALSVLLTGVVMNPVLQRANDDALQPYFNNQLTQVEAYKKAIVPFRQFMLANTRDKDLSLFTELNGAADVATVDDIPTVTLMSAFITSELRTSFQMGFVIFLPFIVVDLIVASVLMSMGMFMLPPVMISLPFKLLLFVLADGWTLVVQNLVTSFRM
ncbi:MAG: flagellar type III secretion system pore protein FliP [Gemmatimonadota bacterium]